MEPVNEPWLIGPGSVEEDEGEVEEEEEVEERDKAVEEDKEEEVEEESFVGGRRHMLRGLQSL